MSNTIDFYNQTIKDIQQGLRHKDFSAKELVSHSLEKIQEVDKDLLAFLTTCEKSALKKAEEIDKLISQKKQLPPLAAIPYSAKDVFSTKGVRTTASSRILENYVPNYDATSIEKLEEAGAILLGKTNCDPFGFGSSTENSDYQTTRNPWNLKKVPGGSSGGSAAAVSAGIGVFSIAEDTGGSIRQPACMCGVSGIKVTYGRVSRYGVIAYGSSLDTIGVIARNITDLAILTGIIAGKDPLDATTLPDKVPNYLDDIEKGIKGVRIGIPKEYFIKGLDNQVEKAIKQAIKKYQDMGAVVEQVSLPHTKYAISSYYLSGISEVSANLARYDGVKFGFSEKKVDSIEDLYSISRSIGFGDEVKRRIMLGTYALSSGYYDAYYKKAQQVRTLLKEDFDKVFKKVDFLIAPVSPFPAFDIGEKADDPLQMWLADIFTVTINPAGVPALAIPCGFTKDNLPIGMQLIGPQLSEKTLFRAGYAYQKTTDWHLKKPDLGKKRKEKEKS